MKVPDETDAQVAHPRLQPHAEIDRRPRRASRIIRIMTRNRLHHQRAITRRASQRPDIIQRKRQRKHTAPRHQTISRLQPDNAAGTRRIADRAARIRTQRRREQPRRHARTGPRRRPARMMREVPRIARRRERQVMTRPTNRKLMRGQLAQDDRPRRPQTRNHLRIAPRDMPLHHPRVTRRRQPRDIDDVLDPDRHAVQLPATPPGRNLLRRQPRLR